MLFKHVIALSILAQIVLISCSGQSEFIGNKNKITTKKEIDELWNRSSNNTFHLMAFSTIAPDSMFSFESHRSWINAPFSATLNLPSESSISISILDANESKIDSALWNDCDSGFYLLRYDWTNCVSGNYIFKLNACDSTLTIQHVYIR